MIRLGVNVDHVATVRNARGGQHPDPFAAALIAGGTIGAVLAGQDGSGPAPGPPAASCASGPRGAGRVAVDR